MVDDPSPSWRIEAFVASLTDVADATVRAYRTDVSAFAGWAVAALSLLSVLGGQAALPLERAGPERWCSGRGRSGPPRMRWRSRWRRRPWAATDRCRSCCPLATTSALFGAAGIAYRPFARGIGVTHADAANVALGFTAS